MNWTNWTKGGGWLVVMLALSWCGGCGGKGEGPNNDIQELAAAVELMDRSLDLRLEAETKLIHTPNDKELQEVVKHQNENFEFFSKKAKAIKARIESRKD